MPDTQFICTNCHWPTEKSLDLRRHRSILPGEADPTPADDLCKRLESRKYSRKWEPIDNYSHRLETPGGWVVQTQFGDLDSHGAHGGSTYSQSICFVPDPDKLWVLEESDG